ncbi:MAG: hypothetical protein JW771_01870 [Candidatus Thermoplasmatota archaeon]|nr:hypothetical protein [Candidatus Thermoplasmatota archaeon]
MSKKFIIIVLLSLFLVATISSSTVIADEAQSTRLIYVDAEIVFDAPASIDVPLASETTKRIDLNVKFKLNLGDLATRLLFNRRIGRLILFRSLDKTIPSATIDLTAECPAWCTATIEPANVTVAIDNQFNEAEATLTLVINGTAPALEEEEITITASFSNANWGIRDVTNSTTITFLPAYESNLTIDATEKIEVPPLNETAIPVNITNNGNGPSKVNISLGATTQHLNCSLSDTEVTIAKGETKEITLFVTPTKKDFTNLSLEVTVTPMSTSDASVDEKYLEGTPVSFTLVLANDGSLDDGNGIPGFELALIVVALIALVVGFIIVKRKNIL